MKFFFRSIKKKLKPLALKIDKHKRKLCFACQTTQYETIQTI